MAIESIELRNFRAFRHATLKKLPALAVLVGPNGSGKSTLFSAFSFLKDALSQNVATAVARQGGFRELVSRGTTGPIGLTVQYRVGDGPLVTYQLEIAEADGQPVVEREILKYRRGQSGQPWHFVDYARGQGTAITNEAMYGREGVTEEREARDLDDPAGLAIKALGQFREFPVVAEFRRMIEHWHISDFQIGEARPSAEAGHAEHLSTRGDNVAQVAQFLYQRHPDEFANDVCIVLGRAIL